MPWAQVSPGRFERDFDSLETFYQAVKGLTAPIGREQYQISVTMNVTPFPSEAELRNGWKALRNQHPQMAAFKQGDRFVYETPNAAQLEQWSAETCFYHHHEDEPGHGTEMGLVAEASVSTKPIDHVELHAFSKTGELQLRTGHWRMDAIGIMHLTDTLLTALASPVEADTLIWAGDEASRLRPDINEALGLPFDDSPERLAAAGKAIQFLAEHPSSMAFPVLPNAMPAEVGCMHRSFGEHETKRLVDACKVRGISVTTALHAALVLAGKKCDLEAREKAEEHNAVTPYRYTDLTVFSLRKYLPEPYSGPSAAATLYHTGLPISAEMPWRDEYPQKNESSDGSLASDVPSQLFSRVTDQIGESYRKDLKTSPPQVFNFLTQWVKILTSIFSMPQPPSPPALPSLSSLGVLENHLKHEYTQGRKSLILKDWRLRVQIVDKYIMCHCWTWRGRLHVQASYNTAFYAESFVKKLVDEWQAVISAQLLA